MFVLSTNVLVIDITACLRQTSIMAEEAIYKAFGRAVATRRRKLELTQGRACKPRVGMSRASVANIESGRQSVLLHTTCTVSQRRFRSPKFPICCPRNHQSGGYQHDHTVRRRSDAARKGSNN